MPTIRSSPDSGTRRSEQVPSVPCEVKEHGHAAVSLGARLGDELDAMVEHPPSDRVDVVDAKEQPDSTRMLAADGNDVSLAGHLPIRQTP